MRNTDVTAMAATLRKLRSPYCCPPSFDALQVRGDPKQCPTPSGRGRYGGRLGPLCSWRFSAASHGSVKLPANWGSRRWPLTMCAKPMALKFCKWTYPLKQAKPFTLGALGRAGLARERLIRKGAPKPLRNLQHIKGFPTLKRMTDRVRVNAANKLVESVTQWCRFLSARECAGPSKTPQTACCGRIRVYATWSPVARLYVWKSEKESHGSCKQQILVPEDCRAVLGRSSPRVSGKDPNFGEVGGRPALRVRIPQN